jgi:hypothetical protein
VLLLIAAWSVFVGIVGVAVIVVTSWPFPKPAGGGRATTFVGRLGALGSPTGLALLCALISLPLVVPTLGIFSGHCSNGEVVPASVVGQSSAAIGAVFIPALVAGTIGGYVVKRHAVIGGLLTFVLALLVAIPVLPLLPAMLGQDVAAGYIAMDCSGATGTQDLSVGLFADLFFVFAPLAEPGPVLILAVGVSIWTYLVRASRSLQANGT